ncbi:RDD family protein [Streptomyces sp. NPDC003090]|uniref:RDD family protein n=1 Tax=Streptomyces sp. NPDC003090 TaxID=3154274 RepID=UPI00380DD8FA
MSNEPPTPGPPPDDDPFRKRPQEPPRYPEGGGTPPPPPPPGSEGPYPGGPPGGGPYGTGGPYGGEPPGGQGPYGTGGPYGGQPPGAGGPYGGGPYDYGGTDPLSGMPPLADTGKRVLARIVDWLVIAIPLGLIGIPFGVYDRVGDESGDIADVWASGNDGGQWVFQLISIVVYVAYDTLMTAKRNGQTLGKRLMRLRVAMLNDGSVPPVNAALMRAMVLWLPALICCACLWPLLILVLILVDKPYKQGLHDKAAKTVVVSTAD